jgi:large subunit ribosomal protein L1
MLSFGTTKRLKRLSAAVGVDVQPGVTMHISDVLELLKSYQQVGATKFNESVDICIKLGTDPKKSDQIIKGNCVLPHGNGNKPKILVFAEGEMATTAKMLGADIVGSDDIIQAIIEGKLVAGRDFSVCIATQDAMLKVTKSKAVQILGRAGVMPNPKLGTVAVDVASVIKETLAGRVSIKSDKNGYIRLSIGKISFEEQKIKDNLFAVFNAVKVLKPASLKGVLFVSIRISTTMMGYSFMIKMSDLYAGS